MRRSDSFQSSTAPLVCGISEANFGHVHPSAGCWAGSLRELLISWAGWWSLPGTDKKVDCHLASGGSDGWLSISIDSCWLLLVVNTHVPRIKPSRLLAQSGLLLHTLWNYERYLSHSKPWFHINIHHGWELWLTHDSSSISNPNPRTISVGHDWYH